MIGKMVFVEYKPRKKKNPVDVDIDSVIEKALMAGIPEDTAFKRLFESLKKNKIDAYTQCLACLKLYKMAKK